MTNFIKDIVSVCLEEDLQRVLHKATDLKEMSAFGREFAQQMKTLGPGKTYTSKITGQKIALKYANPAAQPMDRISPEQYKKEREMTKQNLAAPKATPAPQSAKPVESPPPAPKATPASPPAPKAAESGFEGRMIPSRETGMNKIPEPTMTKPIEPMPPGPIPKGPYAFNKVAPVTSGSKPAEPVTTQSQNTPTPTSTSYTGADAAKDSGIANKSRNDFAKTWNKNPNMQQFSIPQSMQESVVTVGVNKYKVI